MFVALMQRPGIITPTSIERCMQLAYTAKLNSGCISRQVGAAITDKNYSIRAIGWNDAPYGQVPCNLRDRFNLIDGDDIDAYSEFEKKDEKFIIHMKESSVKFNKLNEKMHKFIPDHYMLKRMLFYRYQSMVGKVLKVAIYLPQPALVNFVQKRHIN